MRQKADIVARRNDTTFHSGVGTVQNNRNIAYIYAFPNMGGMPMLGIPPRVAANGLDRNNGYAITNVNTVIVAPDCETVVTSFPGLPDPRNFPGGAFGIGGTPQLFPRSDPRNPGW